MGSTFGGHIATGGVALEHYATIELWLKKYKKVIRIYKGKKYPVGHQIICQVKKNHVSGQDRTVFFPFYPDYGLDDIGSCIGFLLSVKHWSVKDSKIHATDLNNITLPRDKLIQYIEDGKVDWMRRLTADVWAKVQKAVTLERKPRYE